MFIHPDIALQFAAERRRDHERRARERSRPVLERRMVRDERRS
jgi:hypothetical protein